MSCTYCKNATPVTAPTDEHTTLCPICDTEIVIVTVEQEMMDDPTEEEMAEIRGDNDDAALFI